MPIELIQNAALLSITVFGLVWIFQRPTSDQDMMGSIAIGCVYAIAAFLVTATPIQLEDGATIDARAGPVLIAGVLGGPLAGVIAALGGAFSRFLVGGSFAFSGVLVYFLYAVAGTIIWRRWFTKTLGVELSVLRVATAALLSVGAAALMFFIIQPRERALVWISDDFPWIAVANVLSVVLTASFAQLSINYARQSRALRRAFDTIELAKKAGGIGVWTYEPARKIAYWDDSNKELHGITINGNEGKVDDWRDVVHPDDLARVEHEFQMALDDEQPFDTQYRVIHTDGKVRTLKGNALVERSAAGDPQRVVGLNFDLTQLIDAQAQLKETRSIAEQAQKLDVIGKLTGGVAHDFNNLLAIIQGNVEFLIDDEENRQLEPAERLDILTTAISATRRGADLTRSMLAFARQSHLEPQKLHLNEIVRETEKWIARTLPSSIEIETSLQHRDWPVLLDSAGVQSALVNVIVNARDSMPDGGKLTLETANVRIDKEYALALDEAVDIGRYVMIAVSDTGTGIEPEFLSKVFDPFVTSKGMSSGSGLGLSMVEGFARQSGGFVKLYSEVGVGTSLKMFFPVADEDLEGDRTISVPDEKEFSGHGRILVVEDQIEVLGVVVRALQEAGYDVEAASNGDDALRVFEASNSFDLLLTDVVMPGNLNGPELAKACREIKNDLPVIFMSGYASEATVHGNGLRVSDIRLMKPVPKSELLDAVRSQLSKTQ
ncbi:MAG: PAS domain-containing protein [Pseudomonadota bacterium]